MVNQEKMKKPLNNKKKEHTNYGWYVALFFRSRLRAVVVGDTMNEVRMDTRQKKTEIKKEHPCSLYSILVLVRLGLKI